MRRPSSAAALLLLPALLAAAAPPRGEDDIYARGLDDFRQARYVESLESFTELLYLDPATPLGEKARQYIWDITNRIKEEEGRWRLSDEERRRTVLLALQQRELQDRRRRDILSELEAADKKVRQDPSALVDVLRRSRLLGDATEVAEARELEAVKVQQYLDQIRAVLKEEARKDRPEDPRTLHEARGFLWLYEGDLENAVGEWEQALKAAPDDADLKARLDKAKSGLEDKRKQDEILHRLAQGRNYFQVGDDDKARENFDRVLALSPGHPEALRFRGLIDDRVKEKNLQESVGRTLDRAQQALADGKLLDAVSLLAQALGEDPRNEAARAALAEAKRRLSLKTSLLLPRSQAEGKPGAAPNRAEAEEAYTLGMARYVQDDLDHAVVFFKKALALDPTFEEAAGALQAALKEQSAR